MFNFGHKMLIDKGIFKRLLANLNNRMDYSQTKGRSIGEIIIWPIDHTMGSTIDQIKS